LSASAQGENARHAVGNGVQSQSSETIGGGAQNNHEVLTLPTHIGGHLHNPRPAYPEFSKENGEQGEVTLSVMVEPNGRASAVDVVQGSGYARLDRAAHDTVLNQYRFTPATRGGQAIAYRYRIQVE
jgi:protein TonB